MNLELPRRAFLASLAAVPMAALVPAAPCSAPAPLPATAFTTVVIPTRKLMARITISGAALRASEHTSGAFLRAAAAELDAQRRLAEAEDLNRLIRDGRV